MDAACHLSEWHERPTLRLDIICQIYPIRGCTRSWYTGTGRLKKWLQATPPLLSPVSSRFTFAFALSQFSGPNYLGAWNRLLVIRVYAILNSAENVFLNRSINVSHPAGVATLRLSSFFILSSLVLPCEQRFLSWVAFSVYEVVRVACLSCKKPLPPAACDVRWIEHATGC